MITQQELDKQILDDMEKFKHSVYAGAIPVPENIIETFRAAALSLGYRVHNISANTLKVIASTKTAELTNGNLNDIIMIIQGMGAPLGKMYPYKLKLQEKFDHAVEQQIQMEKFILSYNNHINEFQKGLEMKSTRLKDLAGGLAPAGMGTKALARGKGYEGLSIVQQ